MGLGLSVSHFSREAFGGTDVIVKGPFPFSHCTPHTLMTSEQVLFVLGYVLEALGLDMGVSRLLLTFLLQYVRLSLSLLETVLICGIGCRIRERQRARRTILACN